MGSISLDLRFVEPEDWVGWRAVDTGAMRKRNAAVALRRFRDDACTPTQQHDWDVWILEVMGFDRGGCAFN